MALSERDVLAAFSAPTTTVDEQELVDATQALKAPDVLKVLDLLMNRSVALKDPGRHVKRVQIFAKASAGFSDRSLFVPFARALKTADPGLRTALIDALPKVNSPEGHAELIGFLKAPEASLRQIGGRALVKVGGRTAFETIRTMLADPAFPGRLEAIDVVAGLAPQHAAAAIEVIAAVGSVPERTRAVQVLVSDGLASKDPAGVSRALAAFAADSAESVGIDALGGLAKVATPEALYDVLQDAVDDPRIPVAKAAILAAGRYQDPLFVGLLFRKLREGPSALRDAVIEALKDNRTDSAVPLLVYALELKNQALRNDAANTLSALGREGHVELSRTVLWLLKSRDADVRRFGTELANSVPAENLWPRLIQYLKDEDWWVRERVGDVLVKVAPAQVVTPAAEMLSHADPLLRRFGVDLMKRLKNPATLGALVRVAGADADWWVAEGAIEAAGAVGDKRVVPYLLDLMAKRPELQVAAVTALAELGAKDARAHIVALLVSPAPDVRRAVIDALDRLGLSEDLPAVQPLLDDSSATVAARAREFVIKHAAAEAAPAGAIDSQLDELLVAMAEAGADDLLLFAGSAPLVKKMGAIEPLSRPALPPDVLKSLLLPRMSSLQREELAALRDVDFSCDVASRSLRFRAHVFQDSNGFAAVFRIIKNALVSLDALGLPPVVATFADFKNGLVLVGGPTGAGKSTTLASLVDLVNQRGSKHIVSAEDPIEVIHTRVKSLINQRELGAHVPSFPAALRAALRQDPDVLLIGEVRDPDTIGAAITAAETGHLVLGSVHTTSAAATVDRLVSAMPPAEHEHIRNMLAGSLRAVLCQFLLKKKGGGRCLAAEVMINNDAVANLIRKGKAFQIPQVIATAKDQGMQLMDAELMRLLKADVITQEEAYMKAATKKDFEQPEAPRPQNTPAPTTAAIQRTIRPGLMTAPNFATGGGTSPGARPPIKKP